MMARELIKTVRDSVLRSSSGTAIPSHGAQSGREVDHSKSSSV
jgi:hypothetical protein